MSSPKTIDYWNNIYGKGVGPMFPSQFAISVLPDLAQKTSLLDCGCGNGRDSLFFSQHGMTVVGVDGSRSAIDRLNVGSIGARFEVLDFSQSEGVLNFARLNSRKFDAIYARFFLHAIDISCELNFWAMAAEALSTDGRVFLEVRSLADMPNFAGSALSTCELLTDHYRRFINVDELVVRGAHAGMRCIYRVEGYGLAKFRNEDPAIARAIFSRA